MTKKQTETPEKDVIVHSQANLPAMTLDLTAEGALEQAVLRMEKLVEYKDQVVKLCVRRAKPCDIIGMGYGKDEKPYFTESFCELLMSRIGGGEIEILNKELEEFDDGNFGYTVHVKVTIHGLGTSDGIGMATSTDQFLGSVQKKDKSKNPMTDRAGNPVLTRKIDEVSRHNLLQHARTRAVGKALRNLLGLNSYSWADLRAMGLNQNASASVNYGNQSNGAPDELTEKLRGFVKNKIFNWTQITEVQKDLNINDCRALELPAEDMKKLVTELDKRASEFQG